MKTAYGNFARTAATVMACALLIAAAQHAAEIKVVTSGTFRAAYLELIPDMNGPRTTNL
jgi:hypothetical protein